MPTTTEQNNVKVGLIGVPFSKGQPRHGTDIGPQKLREGGVVEKLREQYIDVTDYGDLPLEAYPDDKMYENAKNPKTVGAATNKISDAVSKIVKEGKTCLALGGDHSMAIGTIHGQWKAQSDLCVIWVDAHADINTPLTSGSGNMHGMPLSFLVKELQQYLPKMPGFENIQPCISAKDLAYIGLRDVDPGERKIIETFGITAFSMQEVDRYGINKVVEMALQAVDPKGERPIHLSFDVDSLDPCLIPSTGTPVPGGLSLREGLYIAEELASTGRVSCVDIAEVNPNIGTEEDVNKTVSMTLQIIQSCCGRRRQGMYPAGYHIPRSFQI